MALPEPCPRLSPPPLCSSVLAPVCAPPQYSNNIAQYLCKGFRVCGKVTGAASIPAPCAGDSVTARAHVCVPLRVFASMCVHVRAREGGRSNCEWQDRRRTATGPSTCPPTSPRLLSLSCRRPLLHTRPSLSSSRSLALSPPPTPGVSLPCLSSPTPSAPPSMRRAKHTDALAASCSIPLYHSASHTPDTRQTHARHTLRH